MVVCAFSDINPRYLMQVSATISSSGYEHNRLFTFRQHFQRVGRYDDDSACYYMSI